MLVPASALLWGLQAAFLSPTLALLLVGLYHATPGQVGLALAVYNAAGFVAALVVPARADRRRDYLRPMIACGGLTLSLAAVLATTSSLTAAVLALVVLGGPAGVGFSLFFAQLRHTGADAGRIVRTRAVFSFAWVAGPPLATAIMGATGDRSILLALGVVAALNVATTAGMLAQHRSGGTATASTDGDDDRTARPGRRGLVAVLGGFVLLTATNSAAVSVMGLYVTRSLGLDIEWAGIALGVAAGLEIPALLLLARLAGERSSLTLIAAGALAGLGYYLALTVGNGVAVLLGAQVLNALSVAAISGVGITYFQEIVARPGLASGLYSNTRRIGAIVSGPVIGLGALPTLGYRGVFAACAGLTVAGLGLLSLARRQA